MRDWLPILLTFLGTGGGGYLIRFFFANRATRAEALKIEKEAKNLDGEANERIWQRLDREIADLRTRLEAAEERADHAEESERECEARCTAFERRLAEAGL